MLLQGGFKHGDSVRIHSKDDRLDIQKVEECNRNPSPPWALGSRA